MNTSPPLPEHSAPADVRFTRQRRVVYEVLQESLDHPTASEVFVRVKTRMPHISLATVYNCLETLTHASLIRQVNLDRASSRYCANREDHSHFHCEQCGRVSDATPIPMVDAQGLASLWQLPRGTRVTRVETTLRGLCPDCAGTAAPVPAEQEMTFH